MMPTLDREGLDILLKEISEFLHDIARAEDYINYYWEISRRADALICQCLGNEGCQLPVDIVKLAEKMGIQIEEEDLSEFSRSLGMNKRIGEIDMREDIFSKKRICTIYVDENAAPSSKRYAIAHELVHYIMHYEKESFYNGYFIMPMCPARMEEIIADIFAIFLLVPVRSFFKEFSEYVRMRTENEKVPVTTEAWMQYLSERAVLSEYYVAYGYQQFRYVAYLIYQAWYDKDPLFNNMPKMKEEVREQIKLETKDYFNDEIAELVFQ